MNASLVGRATLSTPVTPLTYPPVLTGAVLRSPWGIKVLLEGAIHGSHRAHRAVDHRAGPAGVAVARRGPAGPPGRCLPAEAVGPRAGPRHAVGPPADGRRPPL